MRTITYKLADLGKAVIHLGKANENEATRVQIDAGVLFAEYPTAVPTLKVINPAGTVYSAEVTRDGDYVLWDIKDSDLTENGSGEFQLTFTENGVVVKSAISRTQICPSITGGGTAPDPVQDWLDHAEEVLEEVEDAFPEGGTTGQVLAKKSDADFDTEWVDQGAGGTTDYTDLENKPQIGGVTLSGNKSLSDLGAASAADVSAKYTKPAGGIPASDIADGVIPDPTSIIDDTAGDGDTNKVWSADKSADLMSAINVLEPSASASDVGKMLKVKTVADGKVTEYEFGEGGGGSVTVDDALSTSSTNPVQNKVITGALNVVQAKTDDTTAMSANLIDTNDADFLDGYFISGGAVWTSSAYNATGYILIRPGEKIIVSNDGDPALAEFLCVFTSEDLSSYVLQIKNVYSYTNIYNFNIYVRISYQKTNTKYQIQYGETITPYAPYGKYYIVGLPDLQHNARQRMDIVSNGDITAFDAEMQRALSIGNCDVYIHRGTYEFTNAFIETLFSRTSRCIPIGNGCRYYFETGAKITAKYTGAINNYWFAFGVDPDVRGSFELHNLYLDAAHINYGIHDEYLGLRDHYRNVYDHCRIIVDNTGYTTSDYGQNKCIGGGLGGNAEIIIDGCYFDAVSDPTQDVSYHGQSGNNKGDNANIIVKNSWFKHTLALGDSSIASTDEEKNVIFCGNSMSSDIYYPGGATDEAKWTVTKWNNEIRVS